jgi:Protein of unknown function (DUF2924)
MTGRINVQLKICDSEGATATPATLAHTLAQLDDLDGTDLRKAWSALTNAPVPKVSPSILRLALGYEMQVRTFGGLSRLSQQRLMQITAAKTRTNTVAPGTRLFREWNGVMEVVTIGETGIIRWNDRDWRSLSQVARAITGTHWSGPAFFGLKKRLAA